MRDILVISGGQTGVDQAALRAAKALGVHTGGWAAKGWLTEDGPAPWLGAEYGLRECNAEGYPARTSANAQAGDVTIWVGPTGSPGYRSTVKACRRWGKPMYHVVEGETTPRDAYAWLTAMVGVGVINVAGNRESVNNGVGERAERFLTSLFRLLLSSS